MDYWRECISEVFMETGIVATEEQIGDVAKFVEGAHDQHGMHTGPRPEPTVDPRDQEIRDLKDELQIHQPKGPCYECMGKDLIDVRACGACNGTGYIYGVRRKP